MSKENAIEQATEYFENHNLVRTECVALARRVTDLPEDRGGMDSEEIVCYAKELVEEYPYYVFMILIRFYNYDEAWTWDVWNELPPVERGDIITDISWNMWENTTRQESEDYARVHTSLIDSDVDWEHWAPAPVSNPFTYPCYIGDPR